MIALRHKSTVRGVTLIEVSIVTGILVIIGAVILALVNGSLECWSVGASTASAESSSSIAVQKLANEVRDGSSAGLDGSQLVVNFPLRVTDHDTGEVLYSSGGIGETRRYLLSNGKLLRRIGGVDTIMARGVQSFDISATLGVVTVTITVREQVGRSTVDSTSTARVTLRNYN